MNDFAGTYAEYLERQGDDHLDADQVELRAKSNKVKKPKPAAAAASGGRNNRERSLPKRRDELLDRISVVEKELAAINARYCAPGFFDRTPPSEVEALRKRQAALEAEQATLTTEWELVEMELGALASLD
jgi:hypothetical protein